VGRALPLRKIYAAETAGLARAAPPPLLPLVLGRIHHTWYAAQKGKSLCGSVLHKYIVLPLMELLLAFPK
jgi:hypothetical protein